MLNLASNKGTIQNYVKAVKWHIAHSGLKAEIFKAGSASQIVPKSSKYDVRVQNIAVNGEIGQGMAQRRKIHSRRRRTSWWPIRPR